MTRPSKWWGCSVGRLVRADREPSNHILVILWETPFGGAIYFTTLLSHEDEIDVAR